MKAKHSYEVTVGNIGNVYSGNGRDAKRVFAEYRAQSESGIGRASGESVTLWKDGELVKEHEGSLSCYDMIDDAPTVTIHDPRFPAKPHFKNLP